MFRLSLMLWPTFACTFFTAMVPLDGIRGRCRSFAFFIFCRIAAYSICSRRCHRDLVAFLYKASLRDNDLMKSLEPSNQHPCMRKVEGFRVTGLRVTGLRVTGLRVCLKIE
jgi:hypothetical protein